jgi:hypothetical protein
MFKVIPQRHHTDRNLFLVMVVIAWVSVITGFTNGFIGLAAEGAMHFSFIAYIHIVVFLGWLILFSIQVLLVRQLNIKLHQKLGMLGAALAIAVVIVGVITSLASEHRKYGTESSDPAFLALLFADMLAFAGPTAAGIVLRKSPAEHKRLMLVGTIALLDAGFARYLSPLVASLAGDSYWMYTNFQEGFWPFFYHHILFCFLMIVAVGVYDILTRGKLITSYVLAVLWYLTIMVSSGWLYFNPSWKAMAIRLIGH